MEQHDANLSGSPPQVVQATLSELRNRLGADVVWFGRLGAIAQPPNGTPRLWWSGLWVDGPVAATRALQTLDNRPVTSAVGVETNAAPLTWRVTTFRPGAKGFWTQSFARNVYLNHDLQEEHRLVVADAAGLRGVLAAVWGQRRTGVARRLSRALRDGHARWAHDRLVHLLTAPMMWGAPPAGVAVISATDGVLLASQPAAAWLDPARTPRFLRAIDRSTRIEPLRPPALAFDGAELRLTALNGAKGLSWLVELQPLRLPQPEPAELLTPSQAAVAQWVLRGLTAPAIAVELGKSVETVRSQIKQVYARLGVSNRLELAQRMNTPER